MADDKAPKKPPRPKAQIESDLAAARSRLAANVASLVDEIHPQRMKERQIESARQFVASEAQQVKLNFVTEDGRVRTSRVAVIGAAVLGVVGFIVIVKTLGTRRAKLASGS